MFLLEREACDSFGSSSVLLKASAWLNESLLQSVSDDSVDLGSSDKPGRGKTNHRSNQKPAVSWWPDEHVSEAAASGGKNEASHVDFFF